MTEKNIDTKTDIILPSAQELLEAGVHLGHRTSRWHPKMEQYIFASKNNVHIFDLEKTISKLTEALNFMKGVLRRGGMILFVGTKPVAKAAVKEAARELEMPYVLERWLGGTLTNFKTITKRLQYLKRLEDEEKSGAWEKFTKKEVLQLKREMTKLNQQLEGIRSLVRLPDAVFVADAKADDIAVREAKRMKIPVVGICDTNIDPTPINYPVPANDDASSSLKVLMGAIVANLKGVEPLAPQEKNKGEEKTGANS